MTASTVRHLEHRPESKPAQFANVRPEFIRLPKSGSLCPWSGLSRSKLNELILPSPVNRHRPPVRSISLRNRNQMRAVRLISFDSLMGYLHTLEVGGEDRGPLESATEASDFPTALRPLDTRSNSQTADQLPRTGNRSGNR